MPRIYTSSVIDAPAAKVWEKVRDFNALPRWHPRIRKPERERRAVGQDRCGRFRREAIACARRARPFDTTVCSTDLE